MVITTNWSPTSVVWLYLFNFFVCLFGKAMTDYRWKVKINQTRVNFWAGLPAAVRERSPRSSPRKQRVLLGEERRPDMREQWRLSLVNYSLLVILVCIEQINDSSKSHPNS